MPKSLKISFIFIVLLISVSAWPFRIIFPVDNSTISASDVHIVGVFENDAPVSITVNGNKNEVKSLCAGKDENGNQIYMLMTVVKLEDGINKYEVSQGDEKKSFTVAKVSTPFVINDWSVKMAQFHSDEKNTKLCKLCHKFKAAPDCLNCHKDRLLGSWVHAPVSEGKCNLCHDLDNNFKVIEPSASVCLSCHKELNNKLESAKYRHGPTDSGFCTICHSPHKNTVKTHLRDEVNNLCEQCHILSETGYKYHKNSFIRFHPVNDKSKNLNCVSCHNPHYSNNIKLYNINDDRIETLCDKCHAGRSFQELLKQLLSLENVR